jgi:hypothetical protein
MDGDLQGQAELEQATWLLDDELDAGVVVCEPDAAEDELALKAEPGKPGSCFPDAGRISAPGCMPPKPSPTERFRR